MNKIPKIIHYCWFGNGEKSDLIKKCIASWKEKCPEYEIIEWNEKNFDININDYVNEAYEEKKWAFVSDFARLWIIYNYGGIYLDTDVELIKNLDFLLKYDAFFSSEDNKRYATGLGFGAKKYNKIVKKMMDDYQGEHFMNNGKYDMTPCPVRNTRSIEYIVKDFKEINKLNIVDNIAFFPKEYFCPYDYDSHKLSITENSISIHWYGESWLTKRKKFLKKIKRLLYKIVGEKNYNKIKKKFKKD